MTSDLHDFGEFPKRWERPSTSLGRWSLGLPACFIALMNLLIALLSLITEDRKRGHPFYRGFFLALSMSPPLEILKEVNHGTAT